MAGAGFFGGGRGSMKPKGFLGGGPDDLHQYYHLQAKNGYFPPDSGGPGMMTEGDAFRQNQGEARSAIDRPWPSLFNSDGQSGYFGNRAESHGLVGDLMQSGSNLVGLPSKAWEGVKALAERYYNDPSQLDAAHPGSDMQRGLSGAVHGAYSLAAMPLEAFKHGMESNEPLASPSMTNDALMAGLPSPAMALPEMLGMEMAPGVAAAAFANAPRVVSPLAAMRFPGNNKTLGAAKPLTHSLDGDPLIAKHIAGLRAEGQQDVGLSRSEMLDVANQFGNVREMPDTGGPYGKVNYSPLKLLAANIMGKPYKPDMAYRTTLAKGRIPMDPSHVTDVIGHETGHLVDYTGDLGFWNDKSALHAHPQDLADNWLGVYDKTPQEMGYPASKVPREHVAEALNSYMQAPAEFKEAYPELAESIRYAVNANPKLNKMIQFNANAPKATSPLAALMAGNAEPSSAAAELELKNLNRGELPYNSASHDAGFGGPFSIER